MECQFCKKILSNLYSLKTHQKTVKSCLEIQGKLDDDIFINCKYCTKKFITKHNLDLHYKTCKAKIKKEKEKKEEEKLKNEEYIKQIEKLKKEHIEENIKEIKKLKEEHIEENIKQIEKLKKEHRKEIKNLKEENKLKNLEYRTEVDKLKEELSNVKGQLKVLESNKECLFDIAKQPKVTTNTNTNNKILSIQTHLDFNNTEQLKRLIEEKYDKKYLFQGQKGVAQFAVDYILKDDTGQLKYICTDPSRQIFKYKDSEGCIKKDVEAKKLTGFLVNSGIKERTHDVAVDFWTDENGDVNGEKCNSLLETAQSVKNIKNDNAIFKKELVNITCL